MINIFRRNPSIRDKHSPFIQNVLKIISHIECIISLLLQYSSSQDIDFSMINILNLVFTCLSLIRESNMDLNENSINTISKFSLKV